MGAVSEMMEVLMMAVLGENRSQSPLPGECRFYDSDFHKSEVTSGHTRRRGNGKARNARVLSGVKRLKSLVEL